MWLKFDEFWVLWATLGHFGLLGAASGLPEVPSRSSLLDFWPPWNDLWQARGHFAQPRGRLWASLDPIWGLCNASLSRFGAIWLDFGVTYGPFWGPLKAFWVDLDPLQSTMEIALSLQRELDF